MCRYQVYGEDQMVCLYKQAHDKPGYCPGMTDCNEPGARIYYDYDLQVYVQDGRVKECGHQERKNYCPACWYAGMDVEEVREAKGLAPTPDDSEELAEAHEAFEEAIQEGRLCRERGTQRWAGLFMYMGRDRTGRALFKNTMTRRYLR